MTFTQHSHTELPLPVLSEASDQGLYLESTLEELPLHHFQISSEVSGKALTQVFEHHPLLPGAILMTNNCLLGMVSRQRLLEFLIRPDGIELFLPQPLSVLHSYVRSSSLMLLMTTPIVVAAQMALRRSSADRSEPIVVQDPHSDESYSLLDVHELNIAYWQIRGIETQVHYERAQVQMIQTEKMASLGRLVDGVAHEILDPVSLIWGNLVHVSTYTSQIMEVVGAYTQYFPDAPEALLQLQAEVELDYLRQDLPQTIASMRAGADRLKKLVSSLQNFCHIDDVYPKPANLHDCIDSILLLLKSRLSGEIEIVRNYGHLPPVTCYAGQLNQVFINILTNAADALLNQAVRQNLAEEFGRKLVAPAPKPEIRIKTQVCPPPSNSSATAARWVRIQIADNGPGLSAKKQQQILEAFSVEKRTAKETSLGVSYQIVTAKHGGRLYFQSSSLSDQTQAADSGTEFEILLPLI